MLSSSRHHFFRILMNFGFKMAIMICEAHFVSHCKFHEVGDIYFTIRLWPLLIFQWCHSIPRIASKEAFCSILLSSSLFHVFIQSLISWLNNHILTFLFSFVFHFVPWPLFYVISFLHHPLVYLLYHIFSACS